MCQNIIYSVVQCSEACRAPAQWQRSLDLGPHSECNVSKSESRCVPCLVSWLLRVDCAFRVSDPAQLGYLGIVVSSWFRCAKCSEPLVRETHEEPGGQL